MHIERHPDTLRLRITIDRVFESNGLREAVFERVAEDDTYVILDLGNIAMLHSPVISEIVALHINFVKAGKTLSIAGVHQVHRRIFHHTKLDEFLNFEEGELD